MDAFRVGFVGCGRHSGGRIYPALRDAGLQLVAVCDLDEAKARPRAAAYGVEHVHTDLDTMCQRHELDAVLVVAGPQGHYTATKALLQRGYHVWMEKPCAPTTAEADELARLAASKQRHAQVGFNYRYTLGIQRAVDLIGTGRFAAPAMVSVRWWLGESDTTRFMQHYVCHAVDLLHYLTPGGLAGARPAHIEHRRQDEFDWFVATFRGPSGAIAVLELSPHIGGDGHWARVDLMSRDGTLSVRDFSEVTHYRTAPWGDLAKADSPRYDGDHVWRTEPLLRRGSLWQSWGYQAELARFRETVQGARAPEATVAEAAWGMHVMDELVSATRKA